MSTNHELAKEAAEIWARMVHSYLTKATDGVGGVVRSLDDYADIPELQDQVREALMDAQVLISALYRLTEQVRGIITVRALQVANEALSARAEGS